MIFYNLRVVQLLLRKARYKFRDKISQRFSIKPFMVSEEDRAVKYRWKGH